MDDLKRRFVEADSDQVRDAISREIAELADADAVTVAEIVLAQIKETNRRPKRLCSGFGSMEIAPAISLAYIAKNYFNRGRAGWYSASTDIR